MSSPPLKTLLIILFGLGSSFNARAQDTTFKSKHSAIIFPYPMYKEKWRSSIGFTFLTTPEDITEEVRLRIPCGDFRVMRKINNNFALN